MQSSLISQPNTLSLSRTHFADMPHVFFEDWVDRFPEAVAVSGAGGMFTYAEVERRANQIAHALRTEGVHPGDVVVIALERGFELICTLLGVLKSGAVFAAIDPRAPREALSRTFASADCHFLATRRAWLPGLPETSAQLFFLDDPDRLAFQPVDRPGWLANSQDPACVLFTSGSSGHSKAVLYLH